MKKILKKILYSMVFSQIIYLGVFGGSDNSYYVIQKEKNLCGIFEKGTTKLPNWLQNNWEATFLDENINNKFISNLNCEKGNIANCCKDMGYKYAGVPIGQAYISEQRKAAEFLANKNIIQVRSFNPSLYKLKSNISRKEVMKIVLNISQLKIKNNCDGIFADVVYDWACKYIETALEENYISGNQEFRPDAILTQTEALKLIFKAKGIEKYYQTSSWQEDYISTAYYLNYIDNKFTDYNMPATRGWVFELAAKTYKSFSYEY